jgi:lipopolysaccharide transport system permease protein
MGELWLRYPEPVEGSRRDASILVIEPSRPWRMVDLAEFWRYRVLLYFFVWRDVKVRYKQTAVGVLWVLIRPLLSVLVFTVVFGKLVKVPSDGLPYPIFVLAAMVPWTFFSTAVSTGTNSLVSSAPLITKVYFPRLTVPVSAVLSALFDVAISFILILALMAWYGKTPPLTSLLSIPLLFVLTFIVSLGVSLWLGALNVKWRDVGNAVPFLVQVWMYATPIVYPLSLVPAKWRWVAAINPMTGVTEGFRSALFGRPWDVGSLVFATAVGLVSVASGLVYFRWSERTFADTV